MMVDILRRGDGGMGGGGRNHARRIRCLGDGYRYNNRLINDGSSGGFPRGSCVGSLLRLISFGFGLAFAGGSRSTDR